MRAPIRRMWSPLDSRRVAERSNWIVSEMSRCISPSIHRERRVLLQIKIASLVWLTLATIAHPDWIFLHDGNGMPRSVQQSFLGRENGTDTKNGCKEANSGKGWLQGLVWKMEDSSNGLLPRRKEGPSFKKINLLFFFLMKRDNWKQLLTNWKGRHR